MTSTNNTNTLYVNHDVDYSFLSGFDTITTEQEHQLAELVKPYLDPFQPEQIETHAAFPLKHLEDFATEAEAINFLQQIQYFYLLAHDDFDNPDFSYKDLWMNCHHMHPRKLEGANGIGKDQNDNLVRVPLPVHWYFHYLHQIIAQLTDDNVLLRHATGGCHGTYAIMTNTGSGEATKTTKTRVEDFFEGYDPTELQTRIKESRTYWTRAKILESARKYHTKYQWAKESNRPHFIAVRDKELYQEATKHMVSNQKPTGYWTKAKILESAKKYQTKGEWQTQEGSAYIIARKDKQLFNEATEHMTQVRQQWTKERIIKSAKNYQTKKQWETEDPRAYYSAIRNKQLYQEATEHMEDGIKLAVETRRKQNTKVVMEVFRRYNTIRELTSFENGLYKSYYNIALKDKQLYQEATKHMFKLPISNSNNWQPNITCLYYYLLNNPNLTEHEYLTNDKYCHSLKDNSRNRSKELKNFFNKYKKEFEAWIQDQLDKGIREYDPVNNRYMFTEAFESGELFGKNNKK